MRMLALVLGLSVAGCHGTQSGHKDPRQVLREERPVGATAFVRRGAALRRLGRLRLARDELLIGLSIEPRSAPGHRQLALVEAELGNLGASLAALERSLALDGDQPCARRDLAVLLFWRAWYRLLPDTGFHQRQDAKRDLKRAAQLAPCLQRRVEALLAAPRVARGQRCPGLPPELRPERPPPAGPCRWRRPHRRLSALQSRDLLLGCRGPALALQLESAGCPTAAQQVWRALADEAPSEPRWPLELARMMLVGGEAARVEPLLTSHVYLSGDRADALLRVARTLEAVKLPLAAARRAVEAIVFSRRLEQQLEALRVLARTGSPSQVREAARVVSASDWPAGRARVRRLVERAIRVGEDPRRRPRR